MEEHDSLAHEVLISKMLFGNNLLHFFRVIKILSRATFPNNTLIMKMTQVRSEYKASFDA